MQAIVFLLRRVMLPTRGSLMTFALWISVGGVALGIAQLMLVLSVMTGFQEMLAHHHTRITSELVILPPREQKASPLFRKKIAKVPGIVGVTPFGFGQGMVLKEGVGGVVLEGIDLATSGNVVPWKEVWVEEPDWQLQKRNPRWLWVGVQLAKKLRIKRGDRVNVLIAQEKGRQIIPFTVTAITKFGIYDHDLRYARVDLEVLDRLFGRRGFEPMYKTKIGAGLEVNRVAAEAQEAVGEFVTVKPWSEINQNVFLAVQHQKRVLFLVLEIIVALAAVNVVNLLMMSAQARRRDTAILRAMGMRFWEVVVFFVAKGSIIGILGTGLGVALGLALCGVAEVMQPELLSESIYNVSRLPISVQTGDVILVCVVALLLCVFFSVLPAMKAAVERPVDALRYE